jgi:ABC-type phosphate transport system ATPase subunit
VGERIGSAAGILQRSALLDRLPAQLSGGQRQRVAMGRGLTREPAVFLFDEPLSNLDAKLRVEMRAEIKALHQRLESQLLRRGQLGRNVRDPIGRDAARASERTGLYPDGGPHARTEDARRRTERREVDRAVAAPAH